MDSWMPYFIAIAVLCSIVTLIVVISREVVWERDFNRLAKRVKDVQDMLTAVMTEYQQCMMDHEKQIYHLSEKLDIPLPPL